jgi:hypothetical protein
VGRDVASLSLSGRAVGVEVEMEASQGRWIVVTVDVGCDVCEEGHLPEGKLR